MKKLTAALLISALSASPALACSFQKNADHMMPSQSASMIPEQTQEAMSTFDPAAKPAFEESSEATDPKLPLPLPLPKTPVEE